MMAGFPGGATVLMSVYRKDDPCLLQRAVESVYQNRLQADDFLLVMDGPVPDPLASCIRELQSQKGFRVLPLPENLGLAGALNQGLRTIRTEWVLRADADDFNLPERFQLQAEAIDADPSLDLLGGQILELEDGLPVAIRQVPCSKEAIRRFIRLRNPFNHMTMAYRLGKVLEAGGYPEIFLKEDYALWATLLGRGAQCANLDQVLVHATAGRGMYRRRGGVRYALAEIQLQSHLRRCGLKGPLLAVLHGLVRSGVFLLPGRLRGALYERVLRRQPT